VLVLVVLALVVLVLVVLAPVVLALVVLALVVLASSPVPPPVSVPGSIVAGFVAPVGLMDPKPESSSPPGSGLPQPSAHTNVLVSVADSSVPSSTNRLFLSFLRMKSTAFHGWESPEPLVLMVWTTSWPPGERE